MEGRWAGGTSEVERDRQPIQPQNGQRDRVGNRGTTGGHRRRQRPAEADRPQRSGAYGRPVSGLPDSGAGQPQRRLAVHIGHSDPDRRTGSADAYDLTNRLVVEAGHRPVGGAGVARSSDLGRLPPAGPADRRRHRGRPGRADDQRRRDRNSSKKVRSHFDILLGFLRTSKRSTASLHPPRAATPELDRWWLLRPGRPSASWSAAPAAHWCPAAARQPPGPFPGAAVGRS